MSTSVDFAWARQALAELDGFALPDAADELGELRAAGVGPQRIAALYPFSTADYRPVLSDLCHTPLAARRTLELFQNVAVHDTLGSICAAWTIWSELDRWGGQGLKAHCNALVEKLGFRFAQQRAQYLEYAVSLFLLPRLLHEFALLPEDWHPRLNRQERMLSDLPALATCAEGLLARLRA